MMKREFIILPSFDNSWKSLRMGDDQLRELQIQLLENPQAGDVIPGTNGIRKLRYKLRTFGKRGGCRVIYIDFAKYETTFLLFAYSKSDKSNLTQQECSDLKKLVLILEQHLARRKHETI